MVGVGVLGMADHNLSSREAKMAPKESKWTIIYIYIYIYISVNVPLS